MRQILFLFFLLSSQSWGFIQSEQILISSSIQGLQVTIPTELNIHHKEIQSKKIQIILNEEMQGPTIKKTLIAPFDSIEIYPFNKQTFIVIQAQKEGILFSQTQSPKQLKLFFQIDQGLQWWKYGLVITLLLALIGFLLYLKTKQHKHSSNFFRIKQQYLNKDCVITTLENENASYLIFSSQKGCILLDKQKHTKEDKETR